MELMLRNHLLQWLRADPALAGTLNAITEEAPSRTSLPWLAIAASAATDWSSKSGPGREVRLALEVHHRSDDSAGLLLLMAALEQRIEALPRFPAGHHIAGLHFLRSRSEQRRESQRSGLLEYRFRILTHPQI